jgi:hypothetical protein
MNSALKLGSAVRGGLDRLVGAADAGLGRCARLEAEAADFGGGELVALLGGELDRGDVGLHRRDLALHAATSAGGEATVALRRRAGRWRRPTRRA